MLLKKAHFSFIITTVVLYMLLFISGCKSDKPDISEIPVNITTERFEQDLFGDNSQMIGEKIHALKKKYDGFLDLYLFQITTIGSPDSSLMNDRLAGFISDTNFRNIYNECEKRFKSFTETEKGLADAFKYYSFYFPGKVIPRIITLISGFSYPIVCDSTNLGISLDMYLGSSFHYYSTIDPPLPVYLRNRMRKEYIVCDAMKGWANSDYSIDESTARMIDFMISQGRLLFFLDKITPDAADTLKSGYTQKQLDWCYANEKQIWSFFIDNKLLFSIDPNLMNKFVNDGPTTNGFPKESPGNIGQFIGWQIVRSYMKNNSSVSLQKLMEEKDLTKIFNESKYKPAR